MKNLFLTIICFKHNNPANGPNIFIVIYDVKKQRYLCTISRPEQNLFVYELLSHTQ